MLADSWPVRECLTSQNDELCKNGHVSERRSNNNVQYVENNVYFYFFTLNHKHIALHQIMLFLATSYDPFNSIHYITLVFYEKDSGI